MLANVWWDVLLRSEKARFISKKEVDGNI